MDRVKKIIFQMISSKDSSVDFNLIEQGIDEYIKMNGLNNVSEKLTDKALSEYMKVFLAPFDSFSGKMASEYFENFKLLSDYKRISNGIFEIAKLKLENKEVNKVAIDTMYKDLTKIYSVIYHNPTMQPVLDKYLSESRLDYDFVCDNGSNYSLRIGEYIKKGVRNASKDS